MDYIKIKLNGVEVAVEDDCIELKRLFPAHVRKGFYEGKYNVYIDNCPDPINPEVITQKPHNFRVCFNPPCNNLEKECEKCNELFWTQEAKDLFF
jgi:hypothetical protein